jgi:hypothetical protein
MNNINNRCQAIQREFEPIGPTLLKKIPLQKEYDLPPTLFGFIGVLR